MEQNKTAISHALERIYKEAGKFVVIGFAGRTGGGCLTAARVVLSQGLDLSDVSQSHLDGNEKKKFCIFKSFIEKK